MDTEGRADDIEYDTHVLLCVHVGHLRQQRMNHCCDVLCSSIYSWFRAETNRRMCTGVG